MREITKELETNMLQKERLSCNSEAMVYDARGNGNGGVSCTITGGHQSSISDYTAIVLEERVESYQETTGPLMASGYAKNGTQEAMNGMYVVPDEPSSWDGSQTAPTLTANNANGAQRMPDKENFNAVIEPTPMVRRLTPTECALLQGYPGDWMDIGEWTDSNGKVHKDADAPKYKAAGNSIALPFWQWLAERICAQYDRPVKMASLFDGIGGFPLVFSRCGAEPVWASEIEEFPIAVTKKRFPENGE